MPTAGLPSSCGVVTTVPLAAGVSRSAWACGEVTSRGPSCTTPPARREVALTTAMPHPGTASYAAPAPLRTPPPAALRTTTPPPASGGLAPRIVPVRPLEQTLDPLSAPRVVVAKPVEKVALNASVLPHSGRNGLVAATTVPPMGTNGLVAATSISTMGDGSCTPTAFPRKSPIATAPSLSTATSTATMTPTPTPGVEEVLQDLQSSLHAGLSAQLEAEHSLWFGSMRDMREQQFQATRDVIHQVDQTVGKGMQSCMADFESRLEVCTTDLEARFQAARTEHKLELMEIRRDLDGQWAQLSGLAQNKEQTGEVTTVAREDDKKQLLSACSSVRAEARTDLDAMESRLSHAIESAKLQHSREQGNLSEELQARLRSEIETLLQGQIEDLRALQGQRNRDLEALRTENTQHGIDIEVLQRDFRSEVEALRKLHSGMGDSVHGRVRSDVAAVEGRITGNMEALSQCQSSLSERLQGGLSSLEESVAACRSHLDSSLDSVSTQRKTDRHDLQEVRGALRRVESAMEKLQHEHDQSKRDMDALRTTCSVRNEDGETLTKHGRDIETLRKHCENTDRSAFESRVINEMDENKRRLASVVESLQQQCRHVRDMESMHNEKVASISNRLDSDVDAWKSSHDGLVEGLDSRLKREVESALQSQMIRSDIEALWSEHRADRYDIEALRKLDLPQTIEEMRLLQRQHGDDVATLQTQCDNEMEALRKVTLHSLTDAVHSQLQGDLAAVRSRIMGDIETVTAALRSEIESVQHVQRSHVERDTTRERGLQHHEVDTLLRNKFVERDTDMESFKSLFQREIEGLRSQHSIFERAVDSQVEKEVAAAESRLTSCIEVSKRQLLGDIEELQHCQAVVTDAIQNQHFRDISQLRKDIESQRSDGGASLAQHLTESETLQRDRAEEFRTALAQAKSEMDVFRTLLLREIEGIRSQNGKLCTEVAAIQEEHLGRLIEDLRNDHRSLIETTQEHNLKEFQALHDECHRCGQDVEAVRHMHGERIGNLIDETQLQEIQHRFADELSTLHKRWSDDIETVTLLAQGEGVVGSARHVALQELRNDITSLKQSQGEHHRSVETLRHEDMRRIGELEALWSRNVKEVENLKMLQGSSVETASTNFRAEMRTLQQDGARQQGELDEFKGQLCGALEVVGELKENHASFTDILNNQVKRALEAMQHTFSRDIDTLHGHFERNQGEVQTLRDILVCTTDELRSEQGVLRDHHDKDTEDLRNRLLQNVEALRRQLGHEIEGLRAQQMQTEEVLAQDVGAIKAQLADDIQRLGSASEVVEAIRAQSGSEMKRGSESAGNSFGEVNQSGVLEAERSIQKNLSKTPPRPTGSATVFASGNSAGELNRSSILESEHSMVRNVSKTPPRLTGSVTVPASGNSAGEGHRSRLLEGESAMQMNVLKTPPRLTGSVTVPASANKHSATSFVIATPGDSETEGTFIDDMLGQLRNDVDSVQSNIVKLRSQYRPASRLDGASMSPNVGPAAAPSRACHPVGRAGSACLPVAVGIGKRP